MNTLKKQQRYGCQSYVYFRLNYGNGLDFFRSLIFDEMMGWLSRYLGHDAMTARLEVRYCQPVPLGSRLSFSAVLQRQIKGLLDIHLTAQLEDNSVVAEASGRVMIISDQN